MAAPKSLLRSPKKTRVDIAQNAHNCQHASAHRIHGGDRRLKIFTDPRSPEYFCVECGLRIIEEDVVRLHSLAAQLRGEAILDPPEPSKTSKIR